MKRRLKLILVFCLILMFSMNSLVAFADEGSLEQEIWIEMPIIDKADYSTNNFSQYEPVKIYKTINGNVSEQRFIDIGGTAFKLVRDGNTENIEVCFMWAGTSAISKMRLKKLIIDNGSALNNVNYCTLVPLSGQSYITWSLPKSIAGEKNT